MTFRESPAGDLREPAGAERPPDPRDTALVAAIAAGSQEQNELYLRYRRPLMQIFLQRRIERNEAQDLVQRTFLQAIRKIRTDGLENPGNLGGYLYRTACNLAVMYWRGEFVRRRVLAGEPSTSLGDTAPALEERVERQQLTRYVRELMAELPRQRDREVLQRLYLQEEPKQEVRVAMNLTDLQFNQVLFRARTRFGEILRRHGLDTNGQV